MHLRALFFRAALCSPLLLCPSLGLALSPFKQLKELAGLRGALPPEAAPVTKVPVSGFPNDPPTGSDDPAIDPAALKHLLERSAEEHSGAVIILRNGRLVASVGDVETKVFAMSATKSIVSLAVGRLLEEGRIASLDQPVADFFPQWKQGDKGRITVRMLLNHTSGLDTDRGVSKPEGVVTHALQSPLVFEPGSWFAYNNNAVDLLAGVIEKASGQRADLYIAKHFFEPLGIKDWDWAKDKTGTPLTAGELMIRPMDLAKIAQMVLDGGVWKGQRVINRQWIELSASPSQAFNASCGLLWWLHKEPKTVALTQRLFEMWARVGVPNDLIEPLRPMIGQSFQGVDRFFQAVRDVFRTQPDSLKQLEAALKRHRLSYYEVTEYGPMEGFSAHGWLGQYAVIDSKRRLVGVRMRAARKDDYENPFQEKDSFRDFPQLVHRLLPAP